jgi:translocation and assembly module TamB
MAGLPALDGRLEARLETDSLVVSTQRFEAGAAEFEFEYPRGRGELRLDRDLSDRYLANGSLELTDRGGSLFLDQLVLRFEEDQWNLGGPATFRLQGDSLEVVGFSLLRQGEGGARVEGSGIITRRGPADFNLTASRVDLDRLGRLLQLDRHVSGLVDLDLAWTGTGSDPSAEVRLAGLAVEFEALRFDTLMADAVLASNRLRGNANGWFQGNRSLTAAMDVPVDLSLDRAVERFPNERVEFQMALMEFPVAGLMGFVEGMEQVEGTLNGTLSFGGTLGSLEPGGELVLVDGSAFLPALNIRHRDVQASFRVGGDRAVEVQGSLRSGGTASIQGTVDLEHIEDQVFDLHIEAERLEAMRRRDLTGFISGAVDLTGSFRRPQLAGRIQVDRGELRLEEFVRSASVIDVTNPEYIDLVDESLLSLRPVLLESQNPFLNNLRMDVDLVVSGDTWIRSRKLDVEMAGGLSVVWDRTIRSMVIVGEVNALRGGYSDFGRRFDVLGGSVGFDGTPELNPTLNIQAETRLRTSRGEPLDIVATVEGTLLEPRVSLSSDFQPPIAESDLVSYLLFGQPSYALLEGQGTTVSAGVGLALGYATAALGSELTEGIPFLDYVSVTARPEGPEGAAAVSASQNWATSVEGGLYLNRDFFLGFRIPNLTNPSANQRPDVWTEYTGWGPYRAEIFLEDRFSRDAVSGLGELSFSTSKILGFLVYREWGY